MERYREAVKKERVKMKVLIINLDKNPDRFSVVAKRLTELAVRFERIPGIYGKELGADEKARLHSRFLWWCSSGCRIRDGQLGCTLSHLKAAQRSVDLNEPVCILEDDVSLLDDFPIALKRLEEWLDNSKPQVVLLGNHTVESLDPQWGCHRIRKAAFAEGYVITTCAAKALIAANTPVRAMNDFWGYWERKKVIDLYQVSPHVCEQHWTAEGYRSDVCPAGERIFDVRKTNIVGKIFWKLNRAMGFFIDIFFPCKTWR